MNREELVKALRCCTSGASTAKCKANCVFYHDGDMGKCIPVMGSAVADMLENDRRHIEALMAEIEKLRKQLARTNAEATEYIGDLAKVAAELDALRSQVGVTILEGD